VPGNAAGSVAQTRNEDISLNAFEMIISLGENAWTDLLIRGATIIDGTGGAPRSVDVAVRDGRISAVEARRRETASREIDGTGRVLTPGFIDIHTHSDFTLPLNPPAEAKIRQRVTTEVVGNCGFSVAPALPGKAELLADYLSASAP
jgi:N-acyl-D-amino-acid deacylase